MPELPEVETITRQLNKKVKGKVISRIKIIDYAHKTQGDLKKVSAQVKEVKRRAKLLIFHLSNGYSFIIHLKLTGQLLYYPKLPSEIPKATHLIFYFKDGSVLLFNDFRKFGFVKVMRTKEVDHYLIKQRFGPEPLELKLPQFQKLLLTRPRSKVKPILMDQTFLAGLGNIYAQEACYLAKIMPTRQLSSLTDLEVRKLYHGIRKILLAAIEHQGTSFDTTYRTPENKPGRFDSFLKVYHQAGCKKCDSSLKRMVLASRGTYYCPKCQK